MAHPVAPRDTSSGDPTFIQPTDTERWAPGEAYHWAFHAWLELGLDTQIEGFQAFLDSRPAQRSRWLESATYQTCLPAAATDFERRLFSCQVEILLAIHRHRCRIRDAGYGRVEQMLDLAHRENGSIQISIQLLTDRLQTSSNYLGAQFVHRTRVSFRRYLRLLRTRRAVEWLRGGDLSIRQVATALGHADTAHFAREIRTVLGVPPRALHLASGRNAAPPPHSWGGAMCHTEPSGVGRTEQSRLRAGRSAATARWRARRRLSGPSNR